MNKSKLEMARAALLEMQRQHGVFLRAADEALRAITAAAGILGDSGDSRVRQLMWIVAEDYLVTPHALVGPTRGSPNVCEARQVAMVLCREILKLSSVLIGMEFHRDHGSVLWADKRVADLAAVEPKFAERLRRLRDRCRAAVQNETRVCA